MDDDLTRIAGAICRYLETHAGAMDTAEGIHQWWIDWPAVGLCDAAGHPLHFPPPLDATLSALDHLEAAGLIEQIAAATRVCWRAKRPAP